MCRSPSKKEKGKKKEELPKAQIMEASRKSESSSEKGEQSKNKNASVGAIVRRGKRVKQSEVVSRPRPKKKSASATLRVKRKSSSLKKHEGDSPSGGVEALLPSLGALIIIGFGVFAKLGYRGRPTVAGVDLGTTNSVICVQQQSKGVGKIECIEDPFNNSPIVPSVVSFTEPSLLQRRPPKREKNSLGYDLDPSPYYATVGAAAKLRIDSHPHHTLYHAKRVMGRSFDDTAVSEMKSEVEFEVTNGNESLDNEYERVSEKDHGLLDDVNGVSFRIPFNGVHPITQQNSQSLAMHPYHVGSYVINHLFKIAADHLGHEQVRNAVIAVPAVFNAAQRQGTVQAFKDVGVKVTRILEEPVAAALAYGLQKKGNVEFILVYDFGGGTLDVSILQVSNDGYVEVIGNDGDNQLGGADFDASVAHILLEKSVDADTTDTGLNVVKRMGKVLSLISSDEGNLEERFASECQRLESLPLCTLSSFHTIGEKMKIELSNFPDGSSVVQGTCLGLSAKHDNNLNHLNDVSKICESLETIMLTMTSQEYDSSCEPLYQRSVFPIRRILDDLDLTATDIDEVVMVGGTTRMPQIRKLVQEELKVDNLNTSIDPDLTVAFGAASVID